MRVWLVPPFRSYGVRTTIIDCKKFKVDIADGVRPDPIRITIIGKRSTGSHHLTPKEAERLATALIKAKGTVETKDIL